MRRFVLILIAMCFAPAASAVPINLDAHISNPTVVQDFGTNELTAGTVVTDRLAGLTFGGVASGLAS